jgi:tyrosyl-tRNA synthetase
MGGSDQKFNLLVGRAIQRDYGLPPQIIATAPLLEGLDGIEKMSKSKNNYIGITEPPKVMFRKVMQISDELMYRYYELLTDMSATEIGGLRSEIAAKKKDPMEAKMELGRRVVADFHSQADAGAAVEAFDREVRQGLEPADTETVNLPSLAATDRGIRIDKLLAAVSLADSVTDATRKIKAGAVEVNGSVHRDLLLSGVKGLLVIRVGKKWKRVDASLD